jgi:hypothetical protein
MKILLFMIAVGILSSTAVIARDAEEIKSSKHQMKKALLMMSFPRVRAEIKGLGTKTNSRYMKLAKRPLCAVMLPGALFADVFYFSIASVALPVLGCHLLIDQTLLAIDTHIHNYSSDEIIKISLEGYKKRIEKVAKLLDGKNISLKGLITLCFAQTAWESKKYATHKLILGSKKALSLEIIKEHKDLPEHALTIYKNIAEAAVAMKMFKTVISLDDILEQLSNYYLYPLHEELDPRIENMRLALDTAAKLAERILKEMGTDIYPGIES